MIPMGDGTTTKWPTLSTSMADSKRLLKNGVRITRVPSMNNLHIDRTRKSSLEAKTMLNYKHTRFRPELMRRLTERQVAVVAWRINFLPGFSRDTQLQRTLCVRPMETGAYSCRPRRPSITEFKRIEQRQMVFFSGRWLSIIGSSGSLT